MDTQHEALPGSNIIIDTFQKTLERPVIKKEQTRQRKIASLANSDGFSALQEVIDMYITNLRDIKIDPLKDTPETIGFRYLSAQVAIDYLTAIRNEPDHQKTLLGDE